MLYAWQGEALFTAEFAHLLRAFTTAELTLLRGLLTKQLNCPQTTSIGRLFDAFASLLGLCQRSDFEGQAAMALEQQAMNAAQAIAYPMALIEGDALILDWQPLLKGVLADIDKRSTAQIAANIHCSLAAGLFLVAKKTAATRLALSGGCFQNAYLVEAIMKHSEAGDYTLFAHVNVPPNDGGLALGQIVASALIDS